MTAESSTNPVKTAEEHPDGTDSTSRNWRWLQGWQRRWRQRSAVRLWTPTARRSAVAIHRAPVRALAGDARTLHGAGPQRPSRGRLSTQRTPLTDPCFLAGGYGY